MMANKENTLRESFFVKYRVYLAILAAVLLILQAYADSEMPVWLSFSCGFWLLTLYSIPLRRLYPFILCTWILAPEYKLIYIILLIGTFLTLPIENFLLPITVYFDDTCAFCQRSIRVLKRLDVFNRITPRPSSQLDPSELHYADEKHAYPNAMMSQDVNGQYAGADAVFYAVLRTPLAPFAALGLVPGILHVCRLIYAQISRRRHCAADVCTAPLPVFQYDLPA